MKKIIFYLSRSCSKTFPIQFECFKTKIWEKAQTLCKNHMFEIGLSIYAFPTKILFNGKLTEITKVLVQDCISAEDNIQEWEHYKSSRTLSFFDYSTLVNTF